MFFKHLRLLTQIACLCMAGYKEHISVFCQYNPVSSLEKGTSTCTFLCDVMVSILEWSDTEALLWLKESLFSIYLISVFMRFCTNLFQSPIHPHISTWSLIHQVGTFIKFHYVELTFGHVPYNVYIILRHNSCARYMWFIFCLSDLF